MNHSHRSTEEWTREKTAEGTVGQDTAGTDTNWLSPMFIFAQFAGYQAFQALYYDIHDTQ